LNISRREDVVNKNIRTLCSILRELHPRVRQRSLEDWSMSVLYRSKEILALTVNDAK